MWYSPYTEVSTSFVWDVHQHQEKLNLFCLLGAVNNKLSSSHNNFSFLDFLGTNSANYCDIKIFTSIFVQHSASQGG
jgi:outer membrane biogenesis lipoprotein LolB